MKEQCIEAVTKAAGRKLSQAEIKGIESRIFNARKQLALKDRAAYSAMSEARQLQEAAKMASAELVSEAIRKKAEVIKKAQVVAEFQNFAKDRMVKGDMATTALQRLLAPLRDMMGGTTSVVELRKGIAGDLHRGLTELLDATGKWGGLFQDKRGVEAIIRELFGEDSGNPLAKKAAKAWQDAAERARQQFNAEGGDIGKLEDYHLPQPHDQERIFKAGKDEWEAFIAGKLDRSKYVNVDGTSMTDAQLMEFLGHAYDNITTGGKLGTKPTEGGGGTSRRADRGSQHRQLHFKDADSYITYQQKFGTGDPVGMFFGHFNNLANDIALVKKFGPNPDHMVQYLAKMAERMDYEAGKSAKEVDKNRAEALRLYDFIAGKTEPVHSEGLRHAFDIATGLHVAARLGSATISAICDNATMVMAAQTVRMPVMKLWRNELSALNLANRGEKEFAMRQGLMHETFTSEINRWGTDNLSRTWAGRLAGTVLRASGLHALTGAHKRAFGIGMYDLMGKLTREHDTMVTLHADDAATLDRLGVDEKTFQIWRKAETVSRNGMTDTVLTPDAIYAVQGEDIKALRDAAQKLISVAMMESDVAVPTPSDRSKFEMTGGLQRGTWKGEIMRQLSLFKATPYEVMASQWGRMMAQDGGFNRTIYAAKFLTLATLTGAFAMELNEILQGKDPKDFSKNPWRVGMAAVLKGGGLGFFGDFMFSDTTLQGRTGALAGSMGPSAGGVESLLKLTVGNASKAFQGKPTAFAPDAANLARSVTPGLNLWYAKAVVNHLWMHYIQEALQPGYSYRVEQRAQKEFGQQFWWRPTEGAPSRGPNIGAAVGQ